MFPVLPILNLGEGRVVPLSHGGATLTVFCNKVAQDLFLNFHIQVLTSAKCLGNVS